MFSRLDLFGKPVNLNFNGTNKSRSSAGAWFTILFAGFICAAIYLLGQDLIDHKVPKTIMSEFFEENPSPMVISPDTFNIAFGLQHPTTYLHYIDESIYKAEATLERLVRVIKADGSVDMQWSSTPLATEICTKEHFGQLASNFENLELNQLYCLQRNQPAMEQIRIQGVFESPVFEYVQVMFTQCDNQTSEVQCSPRESLDEWLGGGWFATYFTNLAIEPRNYTSPNVGYRDSFYTTMSNNYYKAITLFLSHVDVTTDHGWVVKEKETDNFIKLYASKEYTNFRKSNQLVGFEIKVSKIKTNYERSYIKVQDVLAQANGIISAGLVAGFIVFMKYSNMKFYEKLINELFDIKAKRDTNPKKNTRKRTSKAFTKKIDADGKNKKNDKSHQVSSDALGSNCPAESPGETRKKITNNPEIIIDGGGTQKNSNSLPSKKNKSFTEQNVCSQVDLNNLESDKLNTSLNKKVKEADQREERKGPSDPNIASTSSNLQTFSSHLLKDKPQKSDHLHTKILENNEVESPGESFLASVNMVDNQQINLQKSEERNHGHEQKPFESQDIEDNSIKSCNINKEKNEFFEDIIQKANKLSAQMILEPYCLKISFWEYIRSFFWKSGELKQKFNLLEEGIRRIEERLNIFNLLKKMREIDKLKLILLDNEQFILFDALPNPELSEKTETTSEERKSFTQAQLKEAKFIAEKKRNDFIKSSYIDLKNRSEKTVIDKKLLEIFDDIDL